MSQPISVQDILFSTFFCSVDISWGIVATTSLEGCTHRLADVRGNAHK